MKRALLILLISALLPRAAAAGYTPLCRSGSGSAQCSGGLNLSAGGFGVPVHAGLTDNYVAIVVGGAITIGPLLAAALPSHSAALLTSGTLSASRLPIIPQELGGFGQSLAGLLTTPSELGYVHGVTGPIQAQIDAVAAAAVALSNATPAAVGSASPGAAATASRSDHTHDHGPQAGGSTHAAAVAGVSAGFISASDQTKLNAIPTPASGSANLATDFVSLTPGTAFANVGLPLSLPSAGTYLITGEVAGYMSTGGVPPFGEETLSIRLRNTTAGSAIVHSERAALKLFDSTAESFLAPMSVLITVGSASTIDLQAAADPGAGTIAAAYITSPGSTLGAGWFTQLSFIKVSN